MKDVLPGFSPVRVPRQCVNRDVFVGSLLYRSQAATRAFIWLVWTPGPGSERFFHVGLGWSTGLDQLPSVGRHEPRVYSLRGPSPEFEAALLDLEQVEGKSAIGGIVIPSPWDSLLEVKATAPRRVLDAAMRAAHAEAAALTEAQRAEAVHRTIAVTMARIASVLPRFRTALETMHGPVLADDDDE